MILKGIPPEGAPALSYVGDPEGTIVGTNVASSTLQVPRPVDRDARSTLNITT